MTRCLSKTSPQCPFSSTMVLFRFCECTERRQADERASEFEARVVLSCCGSRFDKAGAAEDRLDKAAVACRQDMYRHLVRRPDDKHCLRSKYYPACLGGLIFRPDRARWIIG